MTTVRIEIEEEGKEGVRALELNEGEGMLDELRAALGMGADTLIFERDKDEPLSGTVSGRKALKLIAHSANKIEVNVRYEHRTIEDSFPPSKTVHKILQWAVGKKGFNLDSVLSAKANLILPGATDPLPRDGLIGSYVQPGEKELILDLTFKDFTNG